MIRRRPLLRRIPLRTNPDTTRAWRNRTAAPLPAESIRRRSERRDRAHVRAVVFTRDDYRCRLAGIAVPDVGPCWGPLTPHHLRKASQGGAYTADNLVALCAGHNCWVEDHPDTAHRLGLVRRAGDY
jgi:hypothetical protein